MSSDQAFEIPTNIDPSKIPEHVAIIMDGNGRWAKQRRLPRKAGHIQGQKTLKTTLKNCTKLGIKTLTVYTFSTENWARPKQEVSFLLKFFKESIKTEIDELIKEKVKLKFLGDLSKFDDALNKLIKDAEQKTEHHTRIQLNIMLNYGGRDEIVNAVKSYSQAGHKIHDLSEESLSNFMYTSPCRDPEILIRSGGVIRISNFLLWQSAYTEFFFIDTLWPDFDMENLLKIIRDYQKIVRNFGGLN